MTKKAQAGVEFLLTYGWAILIAVAAIGSFVYIGTLNPEDIGESVNTEESSIEEKCNIGSGIICLNQRYVENMIQITIKNERVSDINDISITIDGEGCSTTNSAGSDSLVIGEEDNYFFECSPAAGEFKGTLTFNFKDTGLDTGNSAAGEIILNIP